MEHRLIEIISECLDIDMGSLKMRLNDTTVWDSLARVNALFIIEDEFDIFFDESELKTLVTPNALIEAVMQKGRGE